MICSKILDYPQVTHLQELLRLHQHLTNLLCNFAWAATLCEPIMDLLQRWHHYSSSLEFTEWRHEVQVKLSSCLKYKTRSDLLTNYGVVNGAIFSMIWVRGLGGVDDPRRKVFRDADAEGWLHELWGVVVVIQHRAHHRRRARKWPSAAVTSLDWR